MDEEELQKIHSSSTGAIIPLFYSAFMRMWVFFAIEIIIFCSPLLLSTIISHFPDSSASDVGTLATCFLFVSITYLVTSVFKVLLGKRIAWEKRQWISVEQFIAVQRRWDLAGRIVISLFALLAIGMMILWLRITSTHAPSFLELPSASSSGTGRTFKDKGPIPIN